MPKKYQIKKMRERSRSSLSIFRANIRTLNVTYQKPHKKGQARVLLSEGENRKTDITYTIVYSNRLGIQHKLETSVNGI